MSKIKDAIYRILKKISELLVDKNISTNKADSGFGVIMNEEQYQRMSEMVSTIADETANREKKVSESLQELKKIEYIKTYTAFVRDVTMSITALSAIPGCEKAVEKLSLTLSNATNILEKIDYGEKQGEQTIGEIQVQDKQTPDSAARET